MRRLHTSLLGLGAIAVALLAGCGGGSAPPVSGGSSSGSSGGAAGFAAKVTGVPATVTVQETDQFQFVPSTTTVKVGQVVLWTNQGTTVHNVTFQPGPASDTMNHGDRFELRFTKPGTYSYVCTFHQAQGMKGTITVSA
jgi:plastocyanin